MRFPKGKKERIQIFVLAGIFAIGGIYAFINFVVLEQWNKHKACKTRIAELQASIAESEKAIVHSKNAGEKCSVLRAQLRETDETYVFKPEFNNYDIRVDEYIRRLFADARVAPDGQLTPGEQSVIGRNPPGRLKSFAKTVRCRLSGRRSYEQLKDLFDKFESGNPYVSITRIHIVAAQDTDGQPAQTLDFTVSFPIWGDQSIAEKFKEPVSEPAGGKKGESARKEGDA